MKTILGFFLLLILLHSILGAILPRFDLKKLLLICYAKILGSRGWVLPLVLCARLFPPRYNPISNNRVCKHLNWFLLFLSSRFICSFLRVLAQGLEPKVPDCAVILVCWIVRVVTHVIVMPFMILGTWSWPLTQVLSVVCVVNGWTLIYHTSAGYVTLALL